MESYYSGGLHPDWNVDSPMTSVLIFSRDSKWFGGVVNFVDSLRKSFGSDIECEQFKIGRRTGAIGRLLRPVAPLFDAMRLLFVLVTRRYDAYHVNPSLNYSSLFRDGLFMLVLRLMRARNVLVVFHGWSESVERKIEGSAVQRFLFNAVFGYADHVLVLAEDFRRWLIGMGFDQSRVQLFTTMFDSADFEPLRTARSRDDSRILFLSRLVREKGMYELVDAVRALAPEYPDLRLVIAGTGPDEADLVQYVAERNLTDRTEFLGYVRGADKVKAFAEAGMFVFPTYYGEGCPVSLLEAMAAGLPVITTPAGGIPHIVTEGVNGMLLEKVTPDAIERAMRTLLADESLRRRMGEKNAEDAWSKYSAPVVTRMFEKLYAGKGV